MWQSAYNFRSGKDRTHSHGTPVDVVSTSAVTPSTLNPLPRYYHEFQCHSSGITMVILQTPLPCHCLLYTTVHNTHVSESIPWQSTSTQTGTRMLNHPGFYGSKRWRKWWWSQMQHVHIICTQFQSNDYHRHSNTRNFYRPDSLPVGYWHQRADERHGNPPPR